MSEALLGQNVALIYKFIEQAVRLHDEGQHWRSLDMLRIAGSLVYKNEESEALDDLKDEIERINAEAQKIKSTSDDQLSALREDYLNLGAGMIFVERLEAIRDYMQKAGYYLMMNKGWQFWDPSAGQKSGVKKYDRPALPTELSSRAVKQDSTKSV